MKHYDLGIIGAGGSGLAGAMYAARLGLNTIVFGASSGSELPIGGVITTTHSVENYPGFTDISGFALAKKLEAHARAYDLVTVRNEKVERVEKKGKAFRIKTNKATYALTTVLFATGTKWKELDVPGSKEFKNKGVHYCALCDAPLCKKKVVGVIGGSDTAIKDALLLAKHAKKVYIIYRGKTIHPEPINLKRVRNTKNIEIINNTNITKILGKAFVKRVVLDKAYKGKKELALDAVFVAIGHVVLSELAKPLGVKRNNKKEILINHKTAQTSVPGVFAAGDVTDKAFKQMITGVADACTAAYYASEYVSKD